MTNSGGYAVSRSHGGDRFYNPPAMRRQHHQMLLSPPLKAAKEAGNRPDSDDSAAALSKQPSTKVTNLDRLMESVTPFVLAQRFSEVSVRGQRNREAEADAFFCLEDLWESFREWSVYGVGVPLLLNEEDQIIQYYVPFLSGIQLYIDPLNSSSCRRKSGDESDVEYSRESSWGGSSDCEPDRQSKSADGTPNQLNHSNVNAHQLNRISPRHKYAMSLSTEEVEKSEINKPPGVLLFEYLEQEQPYNRRPLTDKIMDLASQHPELKMVKSCDLMPSSWISVAWYPIYRIPIGHTLRDLDASFLTFHPLSTQSRVSGSVQPQFHNANSRSVQGIIHASSKISLPVFGLASYKLKGSLVRPCGPQESKQENSLLLAADSWLRNLEVLLPDFQFFLAHYSQRR